MRFGVRQGPSNIEIIAVDGGRRVGQLDAQPISWDDLMEASNEHVEKAEAARAKGDQRTAEVEMKDAKVLERCARAFDRLKSKARRDLKLFTVVTASMTERPDRDAQVAHLYRVAAIVAGRRNLGLMAEPCSEHLFGPADIEIARTAWAHPIFQHGLLRSGPVVYAPPSSARAANLKRELLG